MSDKARSGIIDAHDIIRAKFELIPQATSPDLVGDAGTTVKLHLVTIIF